MSHSPRIQLALTTGEPSGIGIDLVLQLAAQFAWPVDLIALGDPDVFHQRAKQLGLTVRLRPYDKQHNTQTRRPCQKGELFVLPITCANPVTAGMLDAGNSEYVLQLLRRATEGCQSGEFAAMVTAPLHKGIINDAGIAFTGHTEFLADLTQAPLPVMMLATSGLRVALATTHLPLKDVSAAITQDSLKQVLTILHHDLHHKFGIDQPHILVCGLNPHAGEGGHLGYEEIDTIIPAVQDLQKQGLNLTGPLPADTLFTPRHLKHADAVLSMFHDQGLPVLKYAGFGKAVNVTLGLPIIRTSVDHGTALDLAGTGKAETGSLMAAIDMAIEMVKRRRSA